MISKLIHEIVKKNAPVVVGLDPNMKFVPKQIQDAAWESCAGLEGEDEDHRVLRAAAEAFYQFNVRIVDASADIVPCVKPQIAMYEQYGLPGLEAYYRTVQYCRSKGLLIIGDVKRGDIGSTSESYALAHLGKTAAFGRKVPAFDTDFATVNPYLGSDGVKPFVNVCIEEDKGIFVLVKTSNPSSGEFQDVLMPDGKPMYEAVGRKVVEWGELSMDGEYSNVGAVVGATYPEQAAQLRALMPHTFILAPGYGAQGAAAEDLSVFFNKDGVGCIVNSSRGILAAWQKEKYAAYGAEHYEEAARAAAIEMIEDLRRVI